MSAPSTRAATGAEAPALNAAAAGLTLVAADAVAPVPWKNGGGLTRELLRIARPGAGDDDWQLRLSLADIAADGPFSAFAGVTRWFAVLSGAGVRLEWNSGRALEMTPASDVLAFDGMRVPHGRLLDGPTRDLNLMVRGDRARARLVRAELGTAWAEAGALRALFTLRALVLRRHGATLALAPRTLAWCTDADKTPWSLAAAQTPAPAPGPAPSAVTGAAPAYWIVLHPGPPGLP